MIFYYYRNILVLSETFRRHELGFFGVLWSRTFVTTKKGGVKRSE
jgi:hypothetical protein